MPLVTTLRQMLRSLPLFLAYGQFGLVVIIDCALVGPLGTTALAGVAFASNVLAPFFIFATALGLALAPRIAREEARDEGGEPVPPLLLLLSSLRAQAIVALASVAIVLIASRSLWLFHQPPDVTATARPYLVGMVPALFPVVAFAALREYAVALGIRGSAALFAGVTLVIKVAVGIVLVHGAGPIAARGLAGAWISTLVACGCATLLFGLDLWRRGRLTPMAAAMSSLRRERVFKNPLFGEGVAIGLQQLFELGAYYFAGIMAGWLGAAALAAHAIGLNVANAAALLSLAIAQTTAAEVGRRARQGRAGGGAAAWAGALTAAAVMTVVAGAVLLARGPLFGAVPEHTSLALLIAFSLVADGAQIALGGALRGLFDAKFLSVVTFCCWWLVWLPAAYILGFVLRLGIYGLWMALCATLLLCTLVLSLRIVRRARTLGAPEVFAPTTT